MLAMAFILTGTFLVAQIFWVCASDPNRDKFFIPQCALYKQVLISALVGQSLFFMFKRLLNLFSCMQLILAQIVF
jgi:hypothetical protein